MATKKKADPLGGQHLVGAVQRVEVPSPVQTALPNASLFGPISCPACKSKISADGKTLHEKSAYLEELIETDTAIDEVEKKLEKQQKTIAGHEATIADLKSQLEAAKSKTPLTTHLDAPKKETAKNVGTQGAQPRSGKASWWD